MDARYVYGTLRQAEVKSLEFVPPSESLSFREQIKKDKVPNKARIVPPDHSGGRA